MLNLKEQFEIYVGSGFPLIAIDTMEIDRATAEIKRMTTELITDLPKMENVDPFLRTNGFKFYVWDVVKGWKDHFNDGRDVPSGIGTKDPIKALQYVLSESTPPGIFVLHNYHLTGYNADKIQYIIELYRECKIAHKHLFFIGGGDIPAEVRQYFVTIDFSLPTEKELVTLISHNIEKIGMKLKKAEIEEAADATLGMTSIEVESSICVAAVTKKGKSLDIPLLYEEKSKSVKKAGLLEYVPVEEGLDSIGGLNDFKKDLETIEYVFKNRKLAQEYKLVSPKGVLMVGVQGCGKSLAAKVTAKTLGVPLFLCKLRNLRGGIVGDTERNTRELLKLFDSLYKCVIWFDEIDKDLSGYKSSGETEAGIMAGVVGSLLTYMQEKKNMVYFFATCNNIKDLPPEFLRRGRLDQTWFIDLPVVEERVAIFIIHLKKVGRSPQKYNIKKLAEITDGFSGAEIESVIGDAMRIAFVDKREFTTNDIVDAIKTTVSLSLTKKEEVTELRTWAKNRARWASATTTKGTKRSTKEMAFWAPSTGKKSLDN